MRCASARQLFGAYWDDDTTQAERETLESHFAGCVACRREYEELSRVLEVAGSLPRIEASPDFLENTLARVRRASPEPDRLPAPRVRWIPATAAVAAAFVLAAVIAPWAARSPGSRIAQQRESTPAIHEAELVHPQLVGALGGGSAGSRTSSTQSSGSERLAAAPDSLFDHNEDVEFILDPVTVRRGRATMTRRPAQVQGERTVITF